jgi:hypothetical protein
MYVYKEFLQKSLSALVGQFHFKNVKKYLPRLLSREVHPKTEIRRSCFEVMTEAHNSG